MRSLGCWNSYCSVCPMASKLVRIAFGDDKSQRLYPSNCLATAFVGPLTASIPKARPPSPLNRRGIIICDFTENKLIVKMLDFVGEHTYVDKNAQRYKVYMFLMANMDSHLKFHTKESNQSVFKLLLLVVKN